MVNIHIIETARIRLFNILLLISVQYNMLHIYIYNFHTYIVILCLIKAEIRKKSKCLPAPIIKISCFFSRRILQSLVILMQVVKSPLMVVTKNGCGSLTAPQRGKDKRPWVEANT